jgi:hypothetical protein
MRASIVVLILTLAGCSTAGPYVTSVVPLAGGGLRIRRCMVEHRWAPVGDSIREGTCSEQTLRPPKEG